MEDLETLSTACSQPAHAAQHTRASLMALASPAWIAAAQAGTPLDPAPDGRLVLIGAGTRDPPLWRLCRGAIYVNVCKELEQPPHDPPRFGDHNVLPPAQLRRAIEALGIDRSCTVVVCSWCSRRPRRSFVIESRSSAQWIGTAT